MITYRKADLNDLSALISLRLEFMKEAQNITSEEQDKDLSISLSDYFRSHMSDNQFIAYLAEDGDQIVGTSGLCFFSRPPSYKNTKGKAAYIMNMYTRPAYRGRGIAFCLFEKLLGEAKALGYQNISLHATKMGKPLYRKFGFQESADEMVLHL